MATYTRTTHTVRCKSADGRFFADVEILDAVALLLPNGYEISYKLTAASPTIIDATGDGNGKDAGTQATRLSHMKRLTGIAEPAQFFDAEICYAFTVTGPNNTQHGIWCPPTVAKGAITDNTGSGLGVPVSAGSTTRAQHVVKLTQQLGGGQQNTASYTLALLTDVVAFEGPPPFGMPYVDETNPDGPADLPELDQSLPLWGEQHGLRFVNPSTVINGALVPSAKCNDTTIYVTDPQTGERVPPDNKDPNVYIFFPVGTGGPFLGAGQAIDMGPIWWLRQVGVNVNVWYWFISPVQQPKAWSYFGEPPEGASPKWGYRGWTLLPDFPVSWILSVNYPLVPIGTYGAPNIETAASGTISGGSITVNWYGLGIPDGTFAVSTLLTYYMPYGAFDLLGPSSAEYLAAATAAGRASAYTDYGGPTPNIWELTGISQPPLVNPDKPWSAITNPHKSPTLVQAQQVCETFVTKWNAVANAVNSVMSSAGGDSVAPWPLVPPPGWDWAKPYGGDTVGTAFMFNNGWVPGVLPNTVSPSTLPTIATGQLDPATWNNEPALSGNPPWLWATGIP